MLNKPLCRFLCEGCGKPFKEDVHTITKVVEELGSYLCPVCRAKVSRRREEFLEDIFLASDIFDENKVRRLDK